MPSLSYPLLSPLSLALDSLRALIKRHDDALRLGLMPALLIFGGFCYGWSDMQRYWVILETGNAQSIDDSVIENILIVLSIFSLGSAIAAINWLRFLLLGKESVRGLGLRLTSHYFRFFIAIFIIGALLTTLMAAISLPLGLLPNPFDTFALIVTMVGVFVLFVRQAFILVSLAIGQRVAPALAWKATAGNGLRIALGLALVEIPIVFFLNHFAILLASIGFAGAAPYAMMFIAAIFQSIIAMAQSGVLANAYVRLVGDGIKI